MEEEQEDQTTKDSHLLFFAMAQRTTPVSSTNNKRPRLAPGIKPDWYSSQHFDQWIARQIPILDNIPVPKRRKTIDEEEIEENNREFESIMEKLRDYHEFLADLERSANPNVVRELISSLEEEEERIKQVAYFEFRKKLTLKLGYVRDSARLWLIKNKK